MKTLKARVVLCAAVACLTACGGGGGGGTDGTANPADPAAPPPDPTAPLPDPAAPPPDPDALPAYPVVFAPNFAPAGPNPLDASFNMRVGERTLRGTDDSARVTVYGLSFGAFSGGAPGQVTLRLPDGQDVVLTSVPTTDTFQGVLSGTTYTLAPSFNGTDFSAVLFERNGPVDSRGYGIIGWETPLSAVPATGSATFAGDSYAVLNNDGSPSTLAPLRSRFEITVDFGSAEVTGDLIRSGPVGVGLADGRVVGNGIQGRLVSTGTGLDSVDGRADGIFYGIGANEVGGTYEGTFAGSGLTGTIAGAFGGGRTP